MVNEGDDFVYIEDMEKSLEFSTDDGHDQYVSPRGEAYDGLRENREPIRFGKAEWIYHEKEIVLVAVIAYAYNIVPDSKE